MKEQTTSSFFDINSMERFSDTFGNAEFNKEALDGIARAAGIPSGVINDNDDDNTSTYHAYNTAKYQYTSAFELDELRSIMPDDGQTKQSIEINTLTGKAFLLEIALNLGQIVKRIAETEFDQNTLNDDIKRFEEKGFRSYRVKNNDKIIFLIYIK